VVEPFTTPFCPFPRRRVRDELSIVVEDLARLTACASPARDCPNNPSSVPHPPWCRSLRPLGPQSTWFPGYFSEFAFFFHICSFLGVTTRFYFPRTFVAAFFREFFIPALFFLLFLPLLGYETFKEAPCTSYSRSPENPI